MNPNGNYKQWGTGIEPEALAQMANACSLPVSVAGALMPDAHVGYGLPIGGVLATDNAVIPYAVGVDIACRVRLSVFDLPAAELAKMRRQLARVLETQTAFGVGSYWDPPREHPVLEDDWGCSPVTRERQELAREQLGSSGGGNHFADFGLFILARADFGLAPGTYAALLTHSGSRGTGAAVAEHYSRLAAALHPELPKTLQRLAWLGLDTDPGREYWAAMELMGRYAAANHEIIHRQIAGALGARVLLSLENHHNFAWRERHSGREVIVHRKGATPAGAGVPGIIPGSMAAPGYIVRGRGEPGSLNSAAHGAGRRLSRQAALRQISQPELCRRLEEHGVELLSGGLDEAPQAYKDIDQVMQAQADLVEVVARFEPKLVKMAPPDRRRHGRGSGE